MSATYGDTVQVQTGSGYVLKDTFVVRYVGTDAEGRAFVFVDDSGTLVAVPAERCTPT